uniref:Ribonuclease H1 n=2 Tax=Lepeophtheirus salmonis TaxID=72036 RepID=D3PIQ7_LEPSM|nr:Ribonuclease H1 [Lepeophtheirus salmonis]
MDELTFSLMEFVLIIEEKGRGEGLVYFLPLIVERTFQSLFREIIKQGIQAISQAIKRVKDGVLRKIVIYTDSKLAINSVEDWMPKWKKNGWKKSCGGHVINMNDFCQLENIKKKEWQLNLSMFGLIKVSRETNMLMSRNSKF